MSQQKQVKDLFDRICGEITSSLTKNVTEVFDKELEKEIKKSKLNTVQNKIEKLKEQKKLIDKEILELEGTKSDLDPALIIDESQKEEIKQLPNGNDLYYNRNRSRKVCNIKQTQFNAAMSTMNTIEFNNFKTWQQIKDQYYYAMGLSSGIKEMRNLIFQLQGYDWHSLGIDIPASFMTFNKVDISNGKISIMALPKK